MGFAVAGEIASKSSYRIKRSSPVGSNYGCTACSQLKVATADKMASSVAVISAFVVETSSEKRIACRAESERGFIAAITCDGSSESARHADPDDAQMPALSRSSSRASDSIPWKVIDRKSVV